MGSLLIAALSFGCGGHEDEHTYDNYGECFEHETEEGATAAGAFAECDEMFPPMYTDRAGCLAFYADIATVPSEAATAHCEMQFPGGGDAGPVADAGM